MYHRGQGLQHKSDSKAGSGRHIFPGSWSTPPGDEIRLTGWEFLQNAEINSFTVQTFQLPSELIGIPLWDKNSDFAYFGPFTTTSIVLRCTSF